MCVCVAVTVGGGGGRKRGVGEREMKDSARKPITITDSTRNHLSHNRCLQSTMNSLPINFNLLWIISALHSRHKTTFKSLLKCSSITITTTLTLPPPHPPSYHFSTKGYDRDHLATQASHPPSQGLTGQPETDCTSRTPDTAKGQHVAG